MQPGLGIAFLSSPGVEREVSEGKLAWTPLANGIMKPAKVSLLVPRGRALPSYQTAFVEILKSEFIDYERVNTRIISRDGSRNPHTAKNASSPSSVSSATR
ncbi:hypothetical protein ABFT80_20500 [Mesorhizobium sp. SB112]|uniref:hypothetical protein n=1 Tax=Mesorhizobium sp. SB112 TaxID=3151853 RepID=UPI0032658A92